MSAELSPHIPDAESIEMTPSHRVLTRLLTVIPAVGLFLLLNTNPFAQSTKLPAPTSHINDFAGVIDSETKSRLESLLQRLKEKSSFELYVATVEHDGRSGDFSVFKPACPRLEHRHTNHEDQEFVAGGLSRVEDIVYAIQPSGAVGIA